MARKMIEAHKEVFRILDDFCASRNDPVKNSGQVRYISGPSKEEKDFLKDAVCKLKLEFTARRRAILYEHKDKSYFCLVGFESSEGFSDLLEERVNGGNFSAIVADLKPKPIASAVEIRNIVEVQDGRLGKDYKGHYQPLMANLFPNVRIFSGPLVSDWEAYRIFFRFCLLECQFNDYWINSDLANSLIELCDVDSLKIPYQTLCRSIFDADPAALFLSLYRCVEALYALKTTSSLVKELNISLEWDEMCVILERRLGWRAPEAASLNVLLQLAEEQSLKEVLASLSISDVFEMPTLANAAGKKIYNLRNALVHFRPVHRNNEFPNIDWNGLCSAMASLVRDIYEKTFLDDNYGNE